MTATQMIAVIQADESGKKIQWKEKIPGAEWCDTAVPVWDFRDFDYRVKPELEKRWLVFERRQTEFGHSCVMFNNPNDAERHKKDYYKNGHIIQIEIPPEDQ